MSANDDARPTAIRVQDRLETWVALRLAADSKTLSKVNACIAFANSISHCSHRLFCQCDHFPQHCSFTMIQVAQYKRCVGPNSGHTPM
jgi:hypothetical protein